MSYNSYALGLSAGILNQFYVSKKVAINVELGLITSENDKDGNAAFTGTGRGMLTTTASMVKLVLLSTWARLLGTRLLM